MPFVGSKAEPNCAVCDPNSIVRPKKTFVMEKKPINQTWIILGFPALGTYGQDRYGYSLTDFIIGEGMSSRLFQEIREKLGLVYSIHSYTELNNIGGCNYVLLGTNKEHAEEAIVAIKKVLDEIKEHGITPEEYRKALGGALRRGCRFVCK